MSKICFTVFPISFLLVGCCFLPGKTEKKVTRADVIGTWQYTADFEKTIIAIEFMEDGTFHQIVKPVGKSNELSQDGSWNLDGADLHLENVLTHEGEGLSEQKGWVPEAADWYLTDNINDKPPFVIFGGTFPDPDSWQEFKKIPMKSKG